MRPERHSIDLKHEFQATWNHRKFLARFVRNSLPLGNIREVMHSRVANDVKDPEIEAWNVRLPLVGLIAMEMVEIGPRL